MIISRVHTITYVGDDYSGSDEGEILSIPNTLKRSRAFYDIHSNSELSENPIRVGICRNNPNKVKLIYQKFVNGRDKKITKDIKSLLPTDITYFSPEFLQTWDKIQVNQMPDKLIKKLSFEQRKAIVKNIPPEKLFRNLKNIESKLTKNNIKEILIMIPNARKITLAGRIKNNSNEDIHYFSKLSSVTIFFFLVHLDCDSAKPVLDKFPLKKIKKLATEKADEVNLNRFCLRLSDMTYLRIVKDLSIEQKITLVEYFQQLDESDRLFLTFMGMTNEEVIDTVGKIDSAILERVKSDLPDDKKDIIELQLENIDDT